MIDADLGSTADWPVDQWDDLQLFLWEQREGGAELPEARLAAQRRFPRLPKDVIDEALQQLEELRSLEQELLGGPGGDDKIISLDSFGGYEVRAVDREDVHCGGLSSVHSAFDTRFGRRIAIKVPLRRFVDDENVCERVRREAALCARLQHPNIVPIYDVGVYEPAGCPYFVMKYVAGATLGERISEDGVGVHNRLRHLQIVRAVVETLAHAHQCEIIHRDLKPDNVMVGQFGEVHLLDWGLARDCRGPAPALNGRQLALERFSQTSPGGVLGTLAYMAPEQALGRTDLHSAKTDVFGIGAMLCFVLTGAPLYSGQWGQVMLDAKRCRTEKALERMRKSQAPAALISLVEQCLDANPDQRPTMQQVDDCLGAYIDGLEQAALRAERRARWAVSLLAAMLLIIVAGVGGFVIHRQYNERMASEQAVLASIEARATAQLDSLEETRNDWASTDRLSMASPAAVSRVARMLRWLDSIETELTPASGFPRVSDRIRDLRNVLRQDQSYVEAQRRQLLAVAEREEAELKLVSSLRQSLDFSESLYQQLLLGSVLPTTYADRAYPVVARPQRLAAFRRYGIDWRTNNASVVTSVLFQMTPEHLREVLVHLWLWQRQEAGSENDALAARIRSVIQSIESDRRVAELDLWKGRMAPRFADSAAALAIAQKGSHVTREAGLLGVATLMDQGETREALSLGSRLADARPADPLVLAALGHLWTEHATTTAGKQSTDCAALGMEYLRGWRSVAPESGLLLAQAYLVGDRLPEAIEVLKSPLWSDGSRGVRALLLGLAHARQGETDAALEQLAGLSGDNTIPHWQTLNETILLADLRRFDQAEVGLAAARGCGAHLLQLVTGIVRIKQGQVADAKAALAGLLDHPDLGAAAKYWLHLAEGPAADPAKRP